MRIFRWKFVELFLFTLRDPGFLIFKNKMIASDDHLFPVYLRGNPMSHHILYFAVHFLMRQSLFLSLGHYCICDRMRKMFFQTGCQTQHAVPVIFSEGNYLCHCRLCLCKGSCLIKDHCLCLGYRF